MTQLASWVALPDRCPNEHRGRGDPQDVATRVLRLLLLSRFRKGSLDSMVAGDFIASHLDMIARLVERGQPIQLTLIGFPFKAPNPLKVGNRTLPDLAEVATVRMLCELRRSLQKVYAPGLEVVIIHDGAYIAEALGVSVDEARSYSDYFGLLLRVTGADSFIRCEQLTELLRAYGPEPDGSAVVRGRAVQVPKAPPDGGAVALRKTLGLLNVRSLPPSSLPAATEAVLSSDGAPLQGRAQALEQRARQAMEQYGELDHLLHQFDPRPSAFPEAIHATTRVQPRRLALWLVRRGRGVLPWHGVGVVRDPHCIEVSHAADVDGSEDYRPVFLEGESTPFLYERVGTGAWSLLGRHGHDRSD